MPTRRNILQGVALVLAQGTLGLSLGPSWARGNVGGVGRLSASQRLILNGLLLSDPNAYLAFAAVVSRNDRGASAQAAFDHEINSVSSLAIDLKRQRLEAALNDKVVLDCIISPSANVPPMPISHAITDAIPRIGFTGLLGYQIGLEIPQEVRTALAEPASLIRHAGVVKILTIAPAEVAPKFASDGLQLFGSETGLRAAFAAGTMALDRSGVLPGSIQQISSAMSEAAISVKNLANGFNAITGAQPGPIPDPNELAASAESALTVLGHLTKMNPVTVQKVNATLQIAGSALSGAITGMALGGPIGGAVGGAIGLLGSLFGGGGEDSTAQMITQIDSRLNELHADMVARFQVLTGQIGNLEHEVRSAFAEILSELQKLQQSINTNLAEVRQLIINVTQQQIQNSVNQFINAGLEHERRYQIAIVGGAVATDIQSQWYPSALSFIDTINVPGSGFSQLAFIGGGYSAFLQELLGHMKTNAGLNINDSFTGSPIRVAPMFTDTSTPPTGPRNVRSAIKQLTQRLGDARYGAAADTNENTKADLNGADLIAFFQHRCILLLKDFQTSPEWAGMNIDQKILIPNPSRLPPAVAPQDLFTIAITSQSVTTEVSDIATARDIMAICDDSLSTHLAAHSLFVGQSGIPALTYVRRQLALQLANRTATVFCNPFMAAVDVLRRAFSTAASADSNYGPRNSPHAFRVTNKSEALALIAMGRALVPLANTATVTLPSASPRSDNVVRSIDRFFNGLPPPGLSRFGYIAATAAYERDVLASDFLDAVKAISGESLSRQLDEILADEIALGVVENCISTRLETLRKAGAPSPSFALWSPGFMPYATVAAAALGQPPPQFTGQPREYNVARAILGTLLVGGGPVIAPTLPPGVPDAGLPYPWQIGDFWGWGVEACRPNAPTDPSLISGLLRPECAFAGSNSAIMGATEALAAIKATLTQYSVADEIVRLVKQSAHGSVRSILRKQLSIT